MTIRPKTFFSQVSKEKKGKVVDARCRDLTNSAVCEKGRQNPGSVELCDWHEVCVPILSCFDLLTMRMSVGIREEGTRKSHSSRHLDIS